jgi:hypothetical protein
MPAYHKILKKITTMDWIKNEELRLKTKRTFFKQGTCSRTFSHIINREYKNPKPTHEHALDPLAGGIAQQGYQCGMLWGAAMGAGTESYRRFKSPGVATGMAIQATQKIHESFLEHAKSPDCAIITNTEWNKRFSILKYMVTGKMVTCFKLAGRWAPAALKAAEEGLAIGQSDVPANTISCASETIRRMGGTEEEAVMVAGFAGGLGLSGNACGALSAAIWINTHTRVKNETYKYSLTDSEIDKIFKAFYAVTDYEMDCWQICGRKFNSVSDHSEFIRNGGCKDVIDALANQQSVELQHPK